MDHILVVDTEYVYRNMGWIKYSIGLAIVGLIGTHSSWSMAPTWPCVLVSFFLFFL